jgi:YidC/Oxa1 family membrane protein insertase
MGTTVTVDLQNNTPNPVILKSNCPNEPLNVFEQQNTTWIPKHKEASIPCTNATDIVAAAGQKQTITFANWNHAIFSEPGEYKVQALVWTQAAAANSGTQETQQTAGQTQIQVTGIQATAAPSTSQQLSTTQQQASGSQQLVAGAPAAGMTSQLIESPAFQIKPQGWFSWLWTTIFYQPIYNSLIFFLNILPGHGLGLAIILLTLLIRTILMIPNQKALESQRRMQDVQPKLNHIKEKYKDNQEMIGKETLAVMQENKVNPLGSCLPLLIQFPILISLYQVVQNGLNADNSYILYSGLQHFNYSTINVIFLGVLDLTKINLIFLPIIVGALQFIQMKLAFSRLQKKSSDGKKEKSEMDSANNMMLYMMPAMIAIFTASVPAGVGIYWSTSTLYAIAQQVVVNKKAQREKDGSAKVRVIETKK